MNSSADIRLLSIVRLLQEPVLLYTRQRVIVYANDAFCNLLGRARGELDGMLLDCVAPGLQAAPGCQPLLHEDGRLREVSLEFDLPLQDEDGLILVRATAPSQMAPNCRDALAVELSGDGTWEWDLVSGKKTHSPAWCSMLGFDAAEVAADTNFWAHHLHPDDRGQALLALEACIEGSSLRYAAEYRLMCRNGQWKWIDARAVLERDEGRPRRLIGIHRDIDALRRMEEACRESRLSFAAWLEQSPDAIAITSCEPEPVYLDANAACCSMLGLERHELIGHPGTNEQLWGSPAQATAARELLMQGVPIIDLPCLIHARDGQKGHASLSAQRIVVDGKYRLLIAWRDVSERVHAEERLRESEERWRFAIEGHGDALWDWNVEARTIYRSPRWLELLDLPAHAATVGIHQHGHVFVMEDLPQLSFGFRDLLAGTTDQLMGECRLRRSDGVIIWTSYRCRVMQRNQRGQAERIIGTTRDISQQRERQRAMELQLDRISHAGRLLVLGEMTSAIAHEINQPLAVISSYAGVLLRKTVDNPELQELAGRVEEQALRAGEIVWRMRQFARQGDMVRRAVHLPEMVQECLQWMKIDGRQSGVEFVTRLDAALPAVLADRVQIQQVLLNLLLNAVQSMQNSPMREVVIRASAERGSRQMLVHVADRGCGLPSHVALDVFKPFFSTRADGLGLGLSISQSIVSRHEGRLWSSPRPGGGTVFSFSLPLAPAASEKRP